MNTRPPFRLLLPLVVGAASIAPFCSSAADAVPPSLAGWWKGRHATGDWFGFRDTLADHGVTPYGGWKGNFYGLTSGGARSPRGAFDEEIILGLKLDFGKLAGIEGLTAQGSVRWRDGQNPNEYVGAGPAFNPSRFQSGVQWRLMPFFLTYATPEAFGVKEFFTISGGWQNPMDFFADQPESKLFTNTAIGTVKGIGANGVGWSSSYAAWGGFLKVKPVEWHYAMAGLYLAIPKGSDSANHGLDLAGYARDPHRNGLYFIGETGLTPKLGEAQLPGKYAFGGLYWGVENTSYFGEPHDGKFALYWQADQMFFRERTPRPAEVEPDGKSVANSKTFKEPASKKESAANNQGLYAFNFLNYAPKYNNVLPFYFHSGLVYKGLFPGRDGDQLGVAFAFGNYSYYKILEDYDEGRTFQQTYEAVIETDYRIQMNDFLHVQPFWQYIIRPGGTGLLRNANIIGLHMGVTF